MSQRHVIPVAVTLLLLASMPALAQTRPDARRGADG